MRPTPFQAFVRIMIGCDKFCTYCIVPACAGPSRAARRPRSSPRSASSPTRASRKSRCSARPSTATSIREPDGRTWRLSDLLARIHDIAGIERIKFITNFPNDMTDDLLEAVRDLPKVWPYLHVPAQTGCDEILKRMKRLYTVAYYREMLARCRETMPGVAITSDFIVGFCGETEESFERTVDLVARSRFKNSFIFKYSARPGTKADRLYRRRRARGGQEAAQQRPAGDPERRSAWRTTAAGSAGRSRCWSRGRAARRLAGTAGTGSTSSRGGRRATGSWSSTGTERLIGRMVRVVVEDASAVTLFGRVETTERIATSA